MSSPQPARELGSRAVSEIPRSTIPRGMLVLWTWRIAIPQSVIHGDIMNIIQDAKKLRTRINSVAKRAGTIQNDIQEVLASGGWHYRQHGDNSLLTMAVNKMPDGYRKDRMTGWVAENFQCKWDNENNRFKKAKVSTFLTDPFDSEKYLDVVKNAWYNFEIETKSNAWMLVKMLEKATRELDKNLPEAKKQVVAAYGAMQAFDAKLVEVGFGKELTKVA